MGMRIARSAPMTRFLAALAVLALIVVGALLTLVLIDWNALKGPIERRVTAHTGHPLSIGELRIAPGRRLWVTAEDVRLGARAGARTRDAFAARRVTAALSWPALAIGKFDLHEL